MGNKNKQFRSDDRMPSKGKIWRNRILTVISVVLIIAGGYLLLLTQFPGLQQIPGVSSSIDLDKADPDDTRNRIQIEKINLEVPYFAGNAEVLEEGAWWRYPERGSPTSGGNFILSAHRFVLGVTPQGTKEKSPFYNLDKLTIGDVIRVYYEGEWYEYEIAKSYSVEPSAIEIEAPSDEHKLTIYSCTLGGAADGRIVLEALPVNNSN